MCFWTGVFVLSKRNTTGKSQMPTAKCQTNYTNNKQSNDKKEQNKCPSL